MSDQDGGKTEPGHTEAKAQETPEPGTDRKEPAGQADSFAENQAAHGSHRDESEPMPAEDGANASELEADPGSTEPEGSEAPSTPAPAERTEDDAGRKGGVFALVAFLIGAVVLGGGGYYLWDAYVGEPPATSSGTEAPSAPEKATSKPAPPEATRDTEGEKTAPFAAMTAKATKAPPPGSGSAPAPAASAAVEAAKSGATAEDSTHALMEMAAKLAATQETIAKLSQRLEVVENLVATPKIDARASLAAREANPANAGVSAARLVVAQSLLAAVRQGDDYTAQLNALQNFGADSARLARLRAGLAAPTVEKLADEFRALAPKLEQAAAPPPAAPSQSEQKPRESFWAHVEAAAGKLVRIRPAGAPDKDAAGMQIDKIEKDLRSGNLATALADRQKLPPQAFALSSNWAASAQTRIDAESAAKEEFAEAMQNLSKGKN